VGIENMLPGVVEECRDNLATVSVNGKHIQAVSDSLAGEKVYVLIRPEDITFNLTGEISSARNLFKSVISRLIPVGALMRIEIDCGFTLLGVLTVNSVEDLNLSIGKELYASFKAAATHTIRRHD
jgi:molybdopterin-binding protein